MGRLNQRGIAGLAVVGIIALVGLSVVAIKHGVQETVKNIAAQL